jgi:hypothetical protein
MIPGRVFRRWAHVRRAVHHRRTITPHRTPRVDPKLLALFKASGVSARIVSFRGPLVFCDFDGTCSPTAKRDIRRGVIWFSTAARGSA